MQAPAQLIVKYLILEAMKTNLNIKLIALTIAFAGVMTSFNAEAQRREYKKNSSEKYEKGHRDHDRGAYHSGKHDNRKEVDRRNDDRRAYQNHKCNDGDRYRSRDRRYDWDDYSSRYHNRYEYHHPKYGHVYRKFQRNPIRLHHNHGDFYFYGGNYYRFYPRVGYVRVEVPRNLIFVDLPFRCERVRIGGIYYYRHNDILFERCDHGYRLAPGININLSAHF